MKPRSLPISRRMLTLLSVGLLAIADLAIIGYVLWFSAPKVRPAAPDPEQSSEPSPSATGREAEIIGPLLLVGKPTGAVLRVTRGSCTGAVAAAWMAPPEGPPEPITVPGLTQMLGAQSTPSGWVIIGADEECKVTAWAAGPAASKWSEVPVPAGVLFLSPEQDGTLRINDTKVDPGQSCAPVSVQTLAPNQNLVLCSSGALLMATTRSEKTALADSGNLPLGTVAFWRRGGRTAVLYPESSCAAASAVIDSAGMSSNYHCFGSGRAPLGITWAADRLVAQVGNDLLELAKNDEWLTR